MTTWSDLWVDKDGNHDARICPCKSCVEIREKAKAAVVSINYVDMVRLQADLTAARASLDAVRAALVAARERADELERAGYGGNLEHADGMRAALRMVEDALDGEEKPDGR